MFLSTGLQTRVGHPRLCSLRLSVTSPIQRVQNSYKTCCFFTSFDFFQLGPIYLFLQNSYVLRNAEQENNIQLQCLLNFDGQLLRLSWSCHRYIFRKVTCCQFGCPEILNLLFYCLFYKINALDPPYRYIGVSKNAH